MRYEARVIGYQFGKKIYGIFDNEKNDFVRDEYGIALTFINKDFAELVASNIHTNGNIIIKVDREKMSVVDVADLISMVHGYLDGDSFSIVAEAMK